MKKITAVAMLTAMIFGLSSICFADFEKGFKVVGVSDGKVSIQKGESEPVEVSGVRGKFTVGELVKYDAEAQKIKKAVVYKAYTGC